MQMHNHLFAMGERVHLPWLSTAGKPIEGTVSAVEPRRFRVTWDREPPLAGGARPSRVRIWYPSSRMSVARGNYQGGS